MTEITNMLAGVTDLLGYMVIQDGEILQVSGDMPDDASLAKHFEKIVNVGTSEQIVPGEEFRSINITYLYDFSYTIAVAGNRIFVVKKGPGSLPAPPPAAKTSA
uniref:Late endosomal/lysosomal adaptor and MAPK and MTOR activator 4 n=1 Tax=Panagrellus redivivus TaxID=6233 RepID=A0A7E4VIQ6_PANRE